MEDWAEIRRLHRAERMGIKAIARHMRVARNTVREAVRSDTPPHYERARKGSLVDAVEPQILVLLREFPTMPATVIAERIGWPYSIRVLRDRVAELRPLFVPPDPCQRTSYRPGRDRPVRSVAAGDPDPVGSRPVRQVVGGGRLDGLLSVPGRLDDPFPGDP